VVYEALALPVPSAGLGPQVDSAARWRGELNAWQANVHDRYAARPALVPRAPAARQPWPPAPPAPPSRAAPDGGMPRAAGCAR
jgi:hypothetical protein